MEKRFNFTNLKKIRRRKGYKTKKEFARAINMSYSTYSKKENGYLDFSIDEAIRISKILQCNIDEIFNIGEA